MTTIIDDIVQSQLKSDVPEFGPGDTVRVNVRVVESGRERTQAFEGVVLARPVLRHQREFYRTPHCPRHRGGTHLLAQFTTHREFERGAAR